VIGNDESGYDTCLGGIQCEDGHALAFVALGASISVGVLAGRRGWQAARLSLSVLILLMLFAMLDELAQGWTGRDASVDDWLADVSGALLGIVAGSQLARLLVQK
jgi:VanZ family protein